MAKDKKKVIRFRSITEYKNLESYLNKMALKGWMLSEIKQTVLTFKKIEAKELEFNVSLLNNMSVFDYPDESINKEYNEICEESGWKKCTSNMTYHIYYKDKNSKATLIHTDSQEEYDIVKSVYKKTEFSNPILLLMMLVMSMVNSFSFNYKVLLGHRSLFNYSFPFIMLIITLILTVPSLIWFRINKENAINNKQLFSFSDKFVNMKNLTQISLMVFYSLAFIFSHFSDSLFGNSRVSLIIFFPTIVSLVLSYYFSKRFKTKKRTRKQNKRFFILSIIAFFIINMTVVTSIMFSNVGSYGRYEVVENKNNYLQLKDFYSDVIEEKNFLESDKSFFIKEYKSYLSYGKNVELSSISTKYYEGINESITNYIFDDIIKEKNKNYNRYNEYEIELGSLEKFEDILLELDTKVWEIDRGYFLNSTKTELILQLDNRIYYIYASLDFMDKSIINICREKLNLNY